MGVTSHLAVHHSRIFCFPISFSLDASLWEWVEVFWWELNGEFTRSHWSECLYPILSHDWSKTLITPLLIGHATLLFSEIRQRKHPGISPICLLHFPPASLGLHSLRFKVVQINFHHFRKYSPNKTLLPPTPQEIPSAFPGRAFWELEVYQWQLSRNGF